VFRRRKNGLLRRAMELSVMADCEVAVLVFHGSGRATHTLIGWPMCAAMCHLRAGRTGQRPAIAMCVSLYRRHRGRRTPCVPPLISAPLVSLVPQAS
jgi:hypothetical protein